MAMLTSSATSWSQSGSPARRVTDQDFKLPLQDLEELEGEVVWLQGALSKGDPIPYRNPIGPVAAYEQGLLDDNQELWTFLDNPKGRELRYNPDLRGQRIVVKGWQYEKSKILEVYSWEDRHSHPVRLNEEFPEPERIPFDPEKAESIEVRSPVRVMSVSRELTDRSLWETGEGTVLQIDPNQVGPLLKSSTAEGQMDRLLGAEVPASASPVAAPPAVEPSPSEPAAPEKPGNKDTEDSVPRPETPRPPERKPSPADRPSPIEPVQPSIGGEPLTTPEEFDEALEESLIE
jgi:hypothetical protein